MPLDFLEGYWLKRMREIAAELDEDEIQEIERLDIMLEY